jgi:hypothetical protein
MRTSRCPCGYSQTIWADLSLPRATCSDAFETAAKNGRFKGGQSAAPLMQAEIVIVQRSKKYSDADRSCHQVGKRSPRRAL